METRGSPERKALSTINNSNIQGVPVSPTANLKLLTSVASELEGIIPKKRVACKTNRLKESDNKTRKDKSLGILCDKFIAMFPLNLPVGCELLEICLDRVSQQLGIVKRRIYDIINILESLNMASKVAKNRYYWHGCQNLVSTLSQLKALALKCGIDMKLQDIQALQKGGFRLVSGPACCQSSSNVSTANSHEYLKTAKEDFFSDERTLGVMCQKFIMLFLASPQCHGHINLDLATRMLVSEASESESERHFKGSAVQCHKRNGEDECNSSSKDCRCLLRLKTKVRRLYDIANVLTSLGLIAKMERPPTSMRKPVFYYTGPIVEAATSVQMISSANIRQSLLSSFQDEDIGMENQLTAVSRKRKDQSSKTGPPEKFPRSSSESMLGGFGMRIANRQQSSVSYGDLSGAQEKCLQFKTSLLQVAEQELEKLRSTEELVTTGNTFGARKKLTFSRCHSDSCIQTQFSHDLKEKCSEVHNTGGVESVPPIPSALSNPLSPTNCVRGNICITISDAKNKRFTITRKLVEVPSHVLPQSLSDQAQFKVPKITQMQAQTLDTLFSLPSTQPSYGSSDHKINPVKFLQPIATDVINNNKPAPALLAATTSGSTQGVFSSCQSIIAKNKSGLLSSISSGDLYRAVRVGNVVRLVPLQKYVSEKGSDKTK